MLLFWIAPVFFLILALRYAVISGGAYYYFWKKNPSRWASRRIQKRLPAQAQLDNELKWSMTTFAILSAGAALIYPLVRDGRTKMYFDFASKGWLYAVASFALLMVIHDTYFYFAHRAMHHPLIFKHVHRIHHLSTNPSPLAAFSFHPVEALVESALFGLVIFIVPLHPAVFALFFIVSHSLNVLGHLGYEIFPKSAYKRFPLNLLNTSTHHNVHHRYFSGNYSLYFNFWDRWLGTNNPVTSKVFEEISWNSNHSESRNELHENFSARLS